MRWPTTLLLPVLLVSCATAGLRADRPPSDGPLAGCEQAAVTRAASQGCCAEPLHEGCALPAGLAGLLKAFAEPLPDTRYDAMKAAVGTLDPGLFRAVCPGGPAAFAELGPLLPSDRAARLFAACAPGLKRFTHPREAARADVQGLLVGAVLLEWMTREGVPGGAAVARHVAGLPPAAGE